LRAALRSAVTQNAGPG